MDLWVAMDTFMSPWLVKGWGKIFQLINRFTHLYSSSLLNSYKICLNFFKIPKQVLNFYQNKANSNNENALDTVLGRRLPLIYRVLQLNREANNMRQFISL